MRYIDRGIACSVAVTSSNVRAANFKAGAASGPGGRIWPSLFSAEGTRRNFRDAAPARMGRRGATDIALAVIFAEAELSAKTAKFCTSRKFCIIGGVFVQCACAYVGVRGHSYGGNPPFEILATPLLVISNITKKGLCFAVF